MDFCKSFNVEIKKGEGTWKVNGGTWHAFIESGEKRGATVYAECAVINLLNESKRAV